MNNRVYKTSGTFDPVGLGLGIAIAVAAMFPIAFLYAYAIRYIPFIYLNFLISFGAVFAVAYAYVWGEGLGKNRSRLASLAGMLFVGILTLYVFWVTFLFVLLRHDIGYGKLLFDPGLIKDLIKELVEVGWFTLKRARVKGTIYGIMLAIEAVTYIVIFVYVWWTALKERVFCEKCQKWVERVTLPVLADASFADAIVNELRQGTDRWLDMLRPTVDIVWLKLELAECTQCRDFPFSP